MWVSKLILSFLGTLIWSDLNRHEWLFPVVKAILVVNDTVPKQLFKWLLVDNCVNVPIEGKALGDKIFSATENVSKNKEFGVGWLLLSVLEKLGKENYESRVLNSHLKVLFLWLLSNKLLFPIVARPDIAGNQTQNLIPHVAELHDKLNSQTHKVLLGKVKTLIGNEWDLDFINSIKLYLTVEWPFHSGHIGFELTLFLETQNITVFVRWPKEFWLSFIVQWAQY